MHKLIYWEMKSRPKKANGKFDTLKVKRKWEQRKKNKKSAHYCQALENSLLRRNRVA